MTVPPEPTNPPAPEPVVPPEPTPPAPPEPPQPAPGTKPEDPMARERRRADAEKRRADALQAQIDEGNRQKAEEEGRFKDLADEQKARADKAEAELQRVKTDGRVKDIAAGLNFRNPADALALLPDSVDRTSDEAVKAGLEQLAADRDYLVAAPSQPAPRPSGTPAGGTPAGDPQGVTADQLRTMTPEQISKLPQAEIDKALGRE